MKQIDTIQKEGMKPEDLAEIEKECIGDNKGCRKCKEKYEERCSRYSKNIEEPHKESSAD
ncbi:MAG: hypothetical protein ABH808_02490 [Candidatus Kuenenbacteria bacterium]